MKLHALLTSELGLFVGIAASVFFYTLAGHSLASKSSPWMSALLFSILGSFAGWLIISEPPVEFSDTDIQDRY
ncbi:hypothetical protein, partial [Parendozoicomonas sp. Alg238-R29]|uniref:hypothetical protein n=1 Tax=Parendozoicomonas sp. Alg238-R29 TaxID=2993446 RepID=UPI00248E9E7E